MSDKNLELIKRRHPDYAGKLLHWNFVESTYEGGRSWFADNIFKYLKEGATEYADRVKRAYRFNHTKQVVDLVDKYLFRQPIVRKGGDAPEYLKRFWKRATRSGLDMDIMAKRISAATSKYGRVYIVVDSTAQPGQVVTRADEKKGAVQVYAYIVRPQDMLDMSFDELGQMRWALVEEAHRDDEDPMASSGGFRRRFRLWTTTDWKLFELTVKGGTEKVKKIDEGEHSLGVVPIVRADHVFSEDNWSTSGLIDDIAYLDRANANYLSNLDAIIQDQTFSQLAMPAQGVLPGESGYDKLIDMGTKRVLLYNGDGGGRGPEYISPDPKQAQMILSAIGKIINEIYHSVGLVGERTGEDNGGGIDNASGVAKAYDFERVNSLLTSKADALQVTERRIATLVGLWNGEKGVTEESELIVYPREFDTRGLYDEFEIGARLNLLAAPEEVRRKQMLQLVKKLFPAASKKEIAEMESSIKDWPPEDLLGLGAKNPAGGPVAAAGAQKTAKELAA